MVGITMVVVVFVMVTILVTMIVMVIRGVVVIVMVMFFSMSRYHASLKLCELLWLCGCRQNRWPGDQQLRGPDNLPCEPQH